MSENLLLKGIKVIDAASFIAGPASTTILSDFGAEVIKIEPPKVGDSLRHLILRTRRVNPQGDKDYCWHLTSRNKKSLALDLNTSKGQEILKELIKEADVFVTNMPKKTREKLKIRAEDLLPINERLVYGSLTGYGESGEDSHRTAFDVLAWWARSGLMDIVRPSDNSSPGVCSDWYRRSAKWCCFVCKHNDSFIQKRENWKRRRSLHFIDGKWSLVKW